MKKILLMGNPNVGKSAIFSRLTGIRIAVSNYPGTTVEFTQGSMMVGEDRALLIDVPGSYGLEAISKAEEIAVDMLEQGDVLINVVDATNLERNLHLTLHLLEQDIPTLVAVNIWDDAQRKGISIDTERLERELGVPVIPTVGISGEGIRDLVSRIPEAANPAVVERTEEDRWTEVGRIVDAVQSLEHRHPTGLEMLGDASVQPVTGIPIALLILLAAFVVVRQVGEGVIGYVMEPVFEVFWKPLMMQLSAVLGPDSFLHSIVVGKLIDGDVDFVQSFGMLTTGLFVPLGMVFPYVLAFYIALGFLEDFGYLPRLAVLLDNTLHRMGIHGWAIIPTLLGLGCNVPGIMATRILESRRERLIAATIISVGVPCAALQAMVMGLLGAQGILYVAIVYITLFVVWLILGRILNRLLTGSSPELIMEVPPYRLPSPAVLARKLWMRMLGFLREALPIVLIGVTLVNVLYFAGVFDTVANFTAPVITRVFGLPKEAVVAIAVGFLRKDVAIGMLGTLGLTASQLVVAATVLAMFFPCVASFVVLWKELGAADTGKSVVTMLVVSVVVGGVLNAIL
ncbi:MAG: ferrous iron transporter B [Candidatus Latescibacteria bacterium]|jgi:ferrous iron transport protein B|nr:ferrous iron transporter B [Candidatus Latescibacterota bacterium]